MTTRRAGAAASPYGKATQPCETTPSPAIKPFTAQTSPPRWVTGVAGGIDINGSPTLIGNTITGNSAEEYGGGLTVGGHSQALIHQNTISANSAITGGGLYLSGQDAEGDEVRITENVIAHNTATGPGGGMSVWDSQPWIQSNDIFSNTAQGSGGGIHAYSTDFGD